jgi:hypothetical protein
VGKLVGVIASVLVGLALASGVTFAVSNASAPDKGVNLDEAPNPNNMSNTGSGGSRGGDGNVSYGSTP